MTWIALSQTCGQHIETIRPGQAMMEPMLLILLLTPEYKVGMTRPVRRPLRPDIEAAIRGGDATPGMDGEPDVETASLDTAPFWQTTYAEILAMEEQVLERINEFMMLQSPQARREVGLTNVPVVSSQAQPFRDRLGFWDARVRSASHPAA